MIKLIALKNAYLKQEDGATAIEYGLIAAGIALAISAAVIVFGQDLTALFESLSALLGGGGP
jgi:pilus assembly protein Flp/PilA